MRTRLAPSVYRTYLILIAIDPHLAVADYKRIDLRYVAHGSGSQYTVQPPRKSVGILFEDLQSAEDRVKEEGSRCTRSGVLDSSDLRSYLYREAR